MNPQRVFTEVELNKARELKATGIGWRKLGPRFGCDGGTLRAALEPGYREKTNSRTLINKKKRREGIPATTVWVPKEPMQTPLEVHPVPTTLDQIYFGDPMPGRSALDQRNGVLVG